MDQVRPHTSIGSSDETRARRRGRAHSAPFVRGRGAELLLCVPSPCSSLFCVCLLVVVSLCAVAFVGVRLHRVGHGSEGVHPVGSAVHRGKESAAHRSKPVLRSANHTHTTREQHTRNRGGRAQQREAGEKTHRGHAGDLRLLPALSSAEPIAMRVAMLNVASRSVYVRLPGGECASLNLEQLYGTLQARHAHARSVARVPRVLTSSCFPLSSSPSLSPALQRSSALAPLPRRRWDARATTASICAPST